MQSLPPNLAQIPNILLILRDRLVNACSLQTSCTVRGVTRKTFGVWILGSFELSLVLFSYSLGFLTVTNQLGVETVNHP